MDDSSCESDIANIQNTPTVTSAAPLSRNPTSTLKTRKKRNKKRKANKIWSYCRQPDSEEPYREGRRRVWYCKYPKCYDYSCVSTNGARYHMERKHKVVVPDEEPTKIAKERDQDIRMSIGEARVKANQAKEALELNPLTVAADITTVRKAILRLIVLHDLPLNLVKRPQFHTLVYSINHCAVDTVFKARSHITRYIHENFLLKQAALKHELQQAQSRIHLGTDTWHAPNRHELQGITAHFVDKQGKLQKALLAIPELFGGHAGEKVAPQLIRVLDEYGIKDRIGYVVGDNHGANDTLCRALAESLEDFDPIERRLRCFCHMVNLAVQAFLYAENDEAVEYADELTTHSKLAVNEQVKALHRGKATAGWINNCNACQKVIGLCKAVRASDSLYNAFKQLTGGKVIHAPNDTRWNSVYDTLSSARAISGQYCQFIHEHPYLAKHEMSIDDWHQIDQTLQFLQPFKELTLRCEGDYVTLDKMQESIYFLVAHYTQHRALHAANPTLSHALYTSWFAFDKYYKRTDDTGAYAAAILLNPNLRKSYLEARWKRSWIASGLRRAKEIWDQYAGEVVTEEHSPELSTFEKWRLDWQKKQRTGNANDEFNRFIHAPSDNTTMPVLEWWQQPSIKEAFPCLYRMAIDVLSAPATSADGERVFSHGRRILPWTLNQKRS